jgi:uncharacterized membrane protein
VILAPRAGLPHDHGMTRQPMSKGRLEAFSDGVIAIIITIMVLELKVPHGADAASLLKVWPVFLSYLLSFLVVAIYWVNHHTLFQAAHHASTGLLWSNNALLFCLSLIPFATGYWARTISRRSRPRSMPPRCCSLACRLFPCVGP